MHRVIYLRLVVGRTYLIIISFGVLRTNLPHPQARVGRITHCDCRSPSPLRSGVSQTRSNVTQAPHHSSVSGNPPRPRCTLFYFGLSSLSQSSLGSFFWFSMHDANESAAIAYGLHAAVSSNGTGPPGSFHAFAEGKGFIHRR